MNMYSLLQATDGKVSMKQVENSFGGNICRCTGYRPILDAFKSLATDSCMGDIEDLTLESCQMEKNRKCALQDHCQRKCVSKQNNLLEINSDDGKVWFRPNNLSELLKIFTTKTIRSEYMLVAGNTAHGNIDSISNIQIIIDLNEQMIIQCIFPTILNFQGVYRRSENLTVFIDIKSIPELHIMKADESSLSFGGNVSLNELMDTLIEAAAKCDKYTYGTEMAKHIDHVATVPIRNVNQFQNPFKYLKSFSFEFG